MGVANQCAECGVELPGNSTAPFCPRCETQRKAASPAPRPAMGKTVVLAKNGSSPTAPAKAPAFKPRVFGDYELLAELAEGGMGVVYKARQISLNRLVALKMIRWGQFATDSDVKRFHQEAEAASHLEHPNIVPIYEIGEAGGQHYFSMRLIEGGSLSDRLAEFCKDRRAAVKLLATVARAVHYAHQRGILHRDLKPANILLDAQGRPHITDFGLAKRVKEDSDATHAGIIMGTPNYMSPEQAAGDRGPLTTATDIYSLGGILYVLLTGCAPFESESPITTVKKLLDEEPKPPQEVNPRAGRDLSTICMKCLEKEPARRYGSAEALAEDLERWLRHEPIHARPATLLDHGLKWMRRHPAGAGLIGVSVAAVVALVVLDQENKESLRLARDRAMQSEKLALQQRAIAERSAEESRRQIQRLNVGNGVRLLNDGDAAGALLWFVEALKLESGDHDREETFRLRIGSVLQECPKLIGFSLQSEPVLFAATSADGRRALVVTRHNFRVLNVADGRAVFSPPKNNIQFGPAGAFSADGKTVALATADNSIEVLDAETGKAVCPPLPASAPATFAAFSPDGRRLAVCAANRVLTWNLADGKRALPPLEHRGRVNRAVFSADGKLLATASADKTARVWNAATGQPATPPLPHGDAVNAAAFSPDGTRLVTAGGDRAARVWDTATGELAAPPLPQNGAVLHAEFSPDGRGIVTASSESAARVWNAATGEPLTPPLHHNGAVGFATFSPDGRRVLTTGERSARVWDAATGAPLTSPLLGDQDVLCAAFDAAGRGVLAVNHDQSVRLWLPSATSPSASVLQHDHGVNFATFSPDGRRVVTVCADNTVEIWNAADGRPLGPPLRQPGPVHRVAFTPDERLIVTASGPTINASDFRFWDIATGKPVGRPMRREALGTEGRKLFSKMGERRPPPNAAALPTSVISAVTDPKGHKIAAAFSADGLLVATIRTNASADEVIVTEVATRRPLGPKISLKEHHIAHVAFSPDGQRLLTAGFDNMVNQWDIKTGGELTPALEHNAELDYAAYSPDGKRIVTASADNTARVWDAENGSPITPFLEHSGRVKFAAFSPDGRRVVTASWDNTARVWDALSGEPITPPLLHKDRVEHAAFSPDGRRIVTASEDGTARIWSLPADDRPVTDLVLLAQLLSGRQIDTAGSFATVPLHKLLTDWKTLREKYPADFTADRAGQVSWHEREARDTETGKNWFAAVFHLEQLTGLNPGDAALARRLTLARAELKKSQAAPADRP